MHQRLADLLKAAQCLPAIPSKAVAAYRRHGKLLIEYVNDTLKADPSIPALIGNNPFQMMCDNHQNHQSFMETVFAIGNYELLVKTIPWVYRSYYSHKFSYDYFPLELKTWVLALDKYMEPALSEEIKSVYAWMIHHHPEMILLSQVEFKKAPKTDQIQDKDKASFQAALLQGDSRRCLGMADDLIKNNADIESFYLKIIQPALYSIGMLWERDEISVAQEHLASAIVGRVMSTIAMTKIFPENFKGKIVITASPNEFHEIGAWMLADIFENDGWTVRYLGANTPQEALIDLLKSFKPDILAISVTMPFNINAAKEIIAALKKDEMLKTIRTMIGGRIFNEIAGIWRSTGADGFAADILDAKKMAHNWRKA